MKKFFEIFWSIILSIITVIMVIGGFAIGLWDMFKGIWKIVLDIGDGSWVKGLIFLPFATMGIVQVIRGFFAVIEKDLPNDISYDRLSRKSKIIVWLYWIATIISYVILFIVIQNIA